MEPKEIREEGQNERIQTILKRRMQSQKKKILSQRIISPTSNKNPLMKKRKNLRSLRKDFCLCASAVKVTTIKEKKVRNAGTVNHMATEI